MKSLNFFVLACLLLLFIPNSSLGLEDDSTDSSKVVRVTEYEGYKIKMVAYEENVKSNGEIVSCLILDKYNNILVRNVGALVYKCIDEPYFYEECMRNYKSGEYFNYPDELKLMELEEDIPYLILRSEWNASASYTHRFTFYKLHPKFEKIAEIDNYVADYEGTSVFYKNENGDLLLDVVNLNGQVRAESRVDQRYSVETFFVNSDGIRSIKLRDMGADYQKELKDRIEVNEWRKILFRSF